MATQYNEREKNMANITILINGKQVDLREFEALVTKIKELEAEVAELEEANDYLQTQYDEVNDILMEKNEAINQVYLILEQFQTIS
jgi:GTPase SAR1 family protein